MTAGSTPMRKLILIGAGGHARVLHGLLNALGVQVHGVCDPFLSKGGAKCWQGIPILGGDEALVGFDPAEFSLVNGVGQLVGSFARRKVFEHYVRLGFHFPAWVHPHAWVADDVILAEGVQVMAGAVIQPGARVGVNSVVNTRSSVDHDCSVGGHVHVAPGATLCGSVLLEEDVFIGAGATLIQGVKVGRAATVAAGTTVIRDVAGGCTVMGSAMRLRPTKAGKVDEA